MEIKIDIPDKAFTDILKSFPAKKGADIKESVIFSLKMNFIHSMSKDFIHIDSVVEWIDSLNLKKESIKHLGILANAYEEAN